MFYNSGRNTLVDATQKFKFFLEFKGITDKFWVSPPTAPPLLDVTYLSNPDTSLYYFASKINLPSININFERSYVNEIVDYFQEGSIHFEPINITFADFSVNQSNAGMSDIKQIFNHYIQYNFGFSLHQSTGVGDPSFESYNNSFSEQTAISGQTDFDITQLNRTRVVDLPKFCSELVVKNVSVSAQQDYPSLDQIKLFRSAGQFKQLNNYINAAQNNFRIFNPRLTKVDFGEFSYSEDAINTISITLVPEWCTFQSNRTSLR